MGTRMNCALAVDDWSESGPSKNAEQHPDD